MSTADKIQQINDEIQRINTNIADAYDVARNMEAEMPEVENSANLADTISTIKTGGGGGELPPLYKQNFTIVGALTVDANGLASDFAASRYILAPNIDFTYSTEWEYQIAIQTAGTSGTAMYSFNIAASSGNGLFRTSIAGSTLAPSVYYRSFGPTAPVIWNSVSVGALAQNTYYYMRYGRSGSTLYLKRSTDGNNWSTDLETNLSNPEINTNITAVQIIGVSGTYTLPFNGSIDMFNTWAKVDGVYVWHNRQKAA